MIATDALPRIVRDGEAITLRVYHEGRDVWFPISAMAALTLAQEGLKVAHWHLAKEAMQPPHPSDSDWPVPVRGE